MREARRSSSTRSCRSPPRPPPDERIKAQHPPVRSGGGCYADGARLPQAVGEAGADRARSSPRAYAASGRAWSPDASSTRSSRRRPPRRHDPVGVADVRHDLDLRYRDRGRRRSGTSAAHQRREPPRSRYRSPRRQDTSRWQRARPKGDRGHQTARSGFITAAARRLPDALRVTDAGTHPHKGCPRIRARGPPGVTIARQLDEVILPTGWKPALIRVPRRGHSPRRTCSGAKTAAITS